MKTRRINDTWFASITINGSLMVASGKSFEEATRKLITSMEVYSRGDA